MEIKIFSNTEELVEKFNSKYDKIVYNGEYVSNFKQLSQKIFEDLLRGNDKFILIFKKFEWNEISIKEHPKYNEKFNKLRESFYMHINDICNFHNCRFTEEDYKKFTKDFIDTCKINMVVEKTNEIYDIKNLVSPIFEKVKVLK